MFISGQTDNEKKFANTSECTVLNVVMLALGTGIATGVSRFWRNAVDILANESWGKILGDFFFFFHFCFLIIYISLHFQWGFLQN